MGKRVQKRGKLGGFQEVWKTYRRKINFRNKGKKALNLGFHYFQHQVFMNKM